MSTFRRLAAGQVATVSNLAIGGVAQVAAVPILLHRWSATALGAWFGVQAMVSLLSCPDWGLLDYAEFRILQLGPRRKKTISRLLGACMWLGAAFGTVEFIVAGLLVAFGWHYALFGLGKKDSQDVLAGVTIAYLISTLRSSVFMSVLSYLNRAASGLGMFSRNMWWSAAGTAATAGVPAIAVWFGASFASAAIWQCLMLSIVCTAQALDFFYRFAKVGITPTRPHRALPGLLFRRARLGYAKNILEQCRQLGVRPLLALCMGPFGAVGVAVFTTIRMIANLAAQVGLTMTNPIIPELSTLIRERKAVQVAGAFTLIWMIMAVVITPGAFFLELAGGPVFHWWTHGKLGYDSRLLATLAGSVICSFAYFPAMAMVRSQNDFAGLTKVMACSSLVLVGAMVALVPLTGPLGAGIALLGGEITVFIMIGIDAYRWMNKLSFVWPAHAGRLCGVSVVAGLAALWTMAWHPSVRWMAAGIGLSIQAALALAMFNGLPDAVRMRLIRKRI